MFAKKLILVLCLFVLVNPISGFAVDDLDYTLNQSRTFYSDWLNTRNDTKETSLNEIEQVLAQTIVKLNEISNKTHTVDAIFIKFVSDLCSDCALFALRNKPRILVCGIAPLETMDKLKQGTKVFLTFTGIESSNSKLPKYIGVYNGAGLTDLWAGFGINDEPSILIGRSAKKPDEVITIINYAFIERINFH